MTVRPRNAEYILNIGERSLEDPEWFRRTAGITAGEITIHHGEKRAWVNKVSTLVVKDVKTCSTTVRSQRNCCGLKLNFGSRVEVDTVPASVRDYDLACCSGKIL